MNTNGLGRGSVCWRGGCAVLRVRCWSGSHTVLRAVRRWAQAAASAAAAAGWREIAMGSVVGVVQLEPAVEVVSVSDVAVQIS
jgi:hypothetical protein